MRYRRSTLIPTGLKGMMTVEAALLVPFLIILTATAVSYIVFVCNRSMMIQDANAACADIMAGNNETDLTAHPYLMMEDISLSVSSEKGRLSVRTSGNWNCMFWDGFSTELSGTETVLSVSPVKVMRITKDILEKKDRITGKDSITDNKEGMEEKNVQDRTYP